MQKIYVNKDKCIGCGMCIQKAPDTFKFDDDNLSEVKENAVINEDTIVAIDNCPTSAIESE